jgi:hypothetical protein
MFVNSRPLDVPYVSVFGGVSFGTPIGAKWVAHDKYFKENMFLV